MRTKSPLEARYGLMVANLTRLYLNASDSARADGVAWYPRARRIIADWSATYNLPVQGVANVVAAISPQCDWNRNLIIADDVLAERTISIGGALHANIRKARALRSSDSLLDMASAYPCGPKVNAFAANLGGDDALVTIDTHATQAALNNPRWAGRVTFAKYTVIARAYMAASHRFGLSPCAFQAIIWHAWKERYSPEDKRERMRVDGRVTRDRKAATA